MDGLANANMVAVVGNENIQASAVCTSCACYLLSTYASYAGSDGAALLATREVLH